MTWVDGPRCDGCQRQLQRARYVLEDLTTGDILHSCGHDCLARIAARRTMTEGATT